MKKIIFLAVIISAMMACVEETEFTNDVFPGFSGKGEYLTWTLNSYKVTDSVYVKGVLLIQIPVITYATYLTNLTNAVSKEVSPYTLRFYQNGEIATVQKNTSNQNVWTKQPSLKWEQNGLFWNINRKDGNNWVNIMVGTEEQGKILLKVKRTFFSDTSADKDKFFLDTFYSKYSYN